MQVTLICGAHIEVKAAAKDKRGNVSKTVETTELDANDVASEEGLAQKILAAYKRRISQVTEIPVSAEGYTLQDVHEDLMLISGSVTSKAQKFYDGGSVWRRAKKLYKTLRNDIHVSYCEVKQEGLLTLSGQNTVEDNKAAILQRYWRNIGSKTHVDLEQGEEEEVEPAPGLVPESAATAATGTDETAMQEVERAVQAANENSQEAATPVQPAPTRNNTPPSACLAVEHPMPPAYKGPLEWEAWLTYGPLGDDPDSEFNVEISEGPITTEVPLSLRKAKRGRQEQRLNDTKRQDIKQLSEFDKTNRANNGSMPVVLGEHGLEGATLLQAKMDGRMQYNNEKIEKLEKRIAILEKLSRPTEALYEELLALLECEDEGVAKYYSDRK